MTMIFLTDTLCVADRCVSYSFGSQCVSTVLAAPGKFNSFGEAYTVGFGDARAEEWIHGALSEAVKGIPSHFHTPPECEGAAVIMLRQGHASHAVEFPHTASLAGRVTTSRILSPSVYGCPNSEVFNWLVRLDFKSAFSRASLVRAGEVSPEFDVLDLETWTFYDSESWTTELAAAHRARTRKQVTTFNPHQGRA